MSYAKPKALRIEGVEYDVRKWAELDVFLVKWLVEQKYLNKGRLPIHNTSRRKTKKELIRDSRYQDYGVWKEAVKGFWVDTQYDSTIHIRNICSYLEQLNVNCDITLILTDEEEVNLSSSAAPPKPKSKDMTIAQLAERMDARFDKIEEKLEEYTKKLEKHDF